MVSEEVGESPFGEFPSGGSLGDVYAAMERDLYSVGSAGSLELPCYPFHLERLVKSSIDFRRTLSVV